MGRDLSVSKLALLFVVGLATVAVPAGIGISTEAQTRAEPAVPESTASNAQFQVATIKPGGPSPRGSGVFINGRRFEVIDTNLQMLISFAYGLHPKQIFGAPDWISKETFDILAVPDGDGQPSAVEWKQMVQKLLAERFNFRFHRDKRTLSVYVLSKAPGGDKLSKSKGDPAALPMVFFPGEWGKLVARNAGVKDFAAQIQGVVLDRPVVDETNLSGRYDFTLSWTPDESQFTQTNAQISRSADEATAPPPLFTAIQEQLGLKLEARTSQADVLVIDNLEKATSN